MKTIISLVLLLFVYTLSAQQINSKKSDTTISLIEISTDSLEELDNINWKDIKEIFSNNQAKDSMQIGFKIKNKKDKLTYTNAFSIKGKTEDIDGTIKMAQKIISIIKKL